MSRYVHPLYTLRDRSRGYEVAVMKAAMTLLGKPAGPVRPPLADCRESDIADLRALLATWSDVLEPAQAGAGR
jgi:5-dehydro-4-deoxyglucarate dehydratase